jgi:diguanylate cyclase (GGDEF)-like protein
MLATDVASFNPFRPTEALRRRRCWLKRSDGTPTCLSFAAVPLLDREGRIIGARGIAVDVTAQDAQEATVAAALRRAELLDHILWQMRREVLAPDMMRSVLSSVAFALGAEGAAAIDPIGTDMVPLVLHAEGVWTKAIVDTAAELALGDSEEPLTAETPDGRLLLACSSTTRFGEHIVFALWRSVGGRAWDAEDRTLVSSATGIIRVVLEHEAVQREMSRQARTDPLTGLLNRRAFFEEVTRRVDRLEREGLPGTLIYVDLDNFKMLSDRQGHEVGDEALKMVAIMLRDAVRPTDLVARLGGDEFALWLDGADHMTAAERPDAMLRDAPARFAAFSADGGPALSLSIGIATRPAGSDEDLDGLTRRADTAMYDVKRTGRGAWRVAAQPMPY